MVLPWALIDAFVVFMGEEKAKLALLKTWSDAIFL